MFFSHFRRTTVSLIVFALLTATVSCSTLTKSETWRGRVGGETVTATVRGVTVTFPAGVAEPGTKAKVTVADTAPDTASDADGNFTSVSELVEITLGDNLQPTEPVTITTPLEYADATTQEVNDRFLLYTKAENSDKTELYHIGAFDVATGLYSVDVDHFSKFRVFGLDLAPIIEEVRDAFTNTFSFQLPAPSCVGNTATVNGTKYSVQSPDMAHVCVNESNGSLAVSAYPAGPMPYLVKSSPQVPGTTASSEVTLGNATMIAFAKALGFIGHNSEAALFPGSEVTYNYKGAPDQVTLSFEQYPVLLLMMILKETLDVIGIADQVGLGDIDSGLGNLQCFVDLAEVSISSEDGIDGELVGQAIKAMFTCFESAAGKSPHARVVLKLLSVAPALLVTGIVGIISPFMGTDRVQVSVNVDRPRPTSDQLVNAQLPPDACNTGEYGWPHSVPIQLNNGNGVARTASGDFGGASAQDAKVLGVKDINGDGKDEVVMSYTCFGSTPELCCAGRDSMATFVGVFHPGEGNTLTKVAPPLSGGGSNLYPDGCDLGRQIHSVTLEGTTIHTTEHITYGDSCTFSEAGGDPARAFHVQYTLSGSSWRASQP